MFSDIFVSIGTKFARISMSVSPKIWRKIVPASFNAKWAAVPCVTSEQSYKLVFQLNVSKIMIVFLLPFYCKAQFLFR